MKKDSECWEKLQNNCDAIRIGKGFQTIHHTVIVKFNGEGIVKEYE